MTDTNTTTKNSKRVKYGFELTFPKTFTLRDLRNAKHHKVKYITLYSRVQKGLENGTIVEAGLKDPVKARRGRKEIVYQTVTPSEPLTTTAEVAVPAVANW